MSSEILLKLTKNEGSDLWSMSGEEWRDGELVGASDVKDATNIQLVSLVSQILVDHE
jgi:hypothetical protein